jgi:ABC-type dipeptide/oligopeptide/nickel transport system permease component
VIRLIVTRLLGGIVTVLVVASIAFLLVKAAPGGPFDAERGLSPEARRNVEERYHLDETVLEQYLRWMKGVVTADLGPTMHYKRSVNEIIATHFPYSMKLGLFALGFALLFGVAIGVTAAARRNTTVDYGFMGTALLGISIPSLVLGPMLQNWFAIGLHWLPIIRVEGFGSYILPGCTLGMIYTGVIARLARGGMLEVLHQDYIRTARAKGLSEGAVVWRHGIRLGLLPVVTYLGPATAALLSGSFVVEMVFQIPGLGIYFIDSVTNRDAALLGGVMVFYVSILVVMNLLVDIAYGFIDPRIRDKR